MANEFNLTEKEMFEALHRSGYLLETEIMKKLSVLGYFVESNQTVLDPHTGKSREIDLIAELYGNTRDYPYNNISVIIKFIIEIKNNLFPLVLLNKMEPHPNIEPWESFKVLETTPDNCNLKSYESFYTFLIENKKLDVYTQYCSFSKKKKDDELMALHPDIIHESLSKIIQYCDEKIETWNHPSEGYIESYLRRHLYLPVLLINDGLYELDSSTTNPVLQKVESSRLLLNYHYKEERRSAMVYIVTKEGLADFLWEMQRSEDFVFEEILKASNITI